MSREVCVEAYSRALESVLDEIVLNEVSVSAEDGDGSRAPVVLDGVVAYRDPPAVLRLARVVVPDRDSVVAVPAEVAVLEKSVGRSLAEVDSVREIVAHAAVVDVRLNGRLRGGLVVAEPEAALEVLDPEMVELRPLASMMPL